MFDVSALNTEADWIAAGELVFDAPIRYAPLAAAGRSRPGVLHGDRNAADARRHDAISAVRDRRKGRSRSAIRRAGNAIRG